MRNIRPSYFVEYWNLKQMISHLIFVCRVDKATVRLWVDEALEMKEPLER